MADGKDTDLFAGGGQREFPTTLWESLELAANGSAEARQTAWNRLIKRYWKPVYAYIRRSWRKGNEESKDSCQEFFLWLMETDDLKALDPEHSSFRGWLKTVLRHFLTDEYRRARQVRRGGRMLHLSLEEIKPEIIRISDASESSPEEEFDRRWVQSLFENAVEDLKAKLEKDGKALYYEVFRRYSLEPNQSTGASSTAELLEGAERSEPTYQQLASDLKLERHDVRNYLAHCRSELKLLLTKRVREYVDSDSDAEAELKELLGG